MRRELTLEDLAVMAESIDLECKAAQGRDGQGELPQDVWKSYCAMANTDGGTILLGVQEKPAGVFKAVGISNEERVRKALWDSLHNRQVVNINLLSESNVDPVVVDGKTHARLREISTDHPADITKMLGRLVKDSFLVPDGVGRGMVYFAPWMSRSVNREAFSSDLAVSFGAKASEFDRKGQELTLKRQELTPKRQELDPKRQEFGLPIWTDRDQISADEWSSLQIIALPVKEHGKVSTGAMQDVIRQLCRDRYVGLRLLSVLTGRNEDHLRNRVLNKMVSTQLLRRAFPRPNDPRQAYTSNPNPGGIPYLIGGHL